MKPFALFAVACGLTVAAAPALAQTSDPAQFMATCSACHQPTGKGIPGAFPALAGDAFVQGDPAKVVAVVLNGRGGMPSFKADLSDTQIAAALTYVRSAWGNHASAVTPAMVAAVRSGGAPAPAAGLQAH